jgi:alanyl-tRNA synthetase
VNEEERFSKALDQGLKALEHSLAFKGENDSTLSGEDAFTIYETYGFPLELITEVCEELGVKVDLDGFNKAFSEHKEKSKMAMDVKFKGGLEGTSDMHIKYHTTTHLLHKALRDVLGDSVHQMGSNITTDRLRFDFSFDRKMTEEEVKAVEDIVNLKISQKLPVQHVDLSKEEAEKTGALHFFGEKYGQVVRVYFIGDTMDSAFSKEFCGGPHVENIGDLGKFKIQKEESSSRGVRRIKAILL